MKTELPDSYLDKIVDKYMSTNDSFNVLSKKTGINKESLIRIVNDEHPSVYDKTLGKLDCWINGEFD